MDRAELLAKAEEAAARLRRLPTGGAGESQLAAVYGDHDWKQLQELELRDRWFLANVWMMENWPPGVDRLGSLLAAAIDAVETFEAGGMPGGPILRLRECVRDITGDPNWTGQK